MERRKEENISNVILRFLRESQLETPLLEYRAVETWSEVAGEAAVRYTDDVRFFNQKLFVSLKSAALRNELMMRRSELVRQINGRLGAHIVTDIVFR